MKTLGILLAVVALGGCATHEATGTLEPDPISAAVMPVYCDENTLAYDERACGQYFYELGVAQGRHNVEKVGWTGNYDAIGSSYLFDQFRAGLSTTGPTSQLAHAGYDTAGTSAPITVSPNSMLNIPQQPGGIERYGDDQATGPVINGVHHGIPAGPPRATCYGAILNGKCTGPEF